MKKLLFIFIFLTFFALVLFSLFDINRVAGVYMEPTIKSGQIVVFRKFGLNNIQRGDIVLYNAQSQNDYIRRIVGLPTESVRVENGNLYLDNNAGQYKVIEDYLSQDSKTYATDEDEWVKIGEFQYLGLPDNRSNKVTLTSDFINKNDIKGILFMKL